MTSPTLTVAADAEVQHDDLPADTRRKVAKTLSAVLAETVLLTLKTQMCHWNVVGPLFKPVHDLTEEHYQNLFAAADEIAERIRALGFPAPVSLEPFAQMAGLTDVSKPGPAQDMISSLVPDHEALVRHMREYAEFAEQNGDMVTHDMLVERMAFHEKAIWMLRAIIAVD